MFRSARLPKYSVLSLLFVTGLAVGAAAITSTPVHAKGEPDTSKCDRFKKGSKDWKKCAGQLKDDLSDNELYYAGYWLTRTGDHRQALTYLQAAKVKDERILTYIGYSTRKLGDLDTAMTYYSRALELNPNYSVARAYLGEALLGLGDVDAARRQLGMIEANCGSSCAAYLELAAEIERHDTGG